MTSIILAASKEVEAKALQNGFRKQEVLIKETACQSTAENKRKLESELFALRPYQFLVSDYWGMGNE